MKKQSSEVLKKLLNHKSSQRDLVINNYLNALKNNVLHPDRFTSNVNIARQAFSLKGYKVEECL